MNVNELMVGDWVNYRGIYNRIAPADFCHFEWINEIKPILLTPEILKKNEFEKWDGWYIYSLENFGIEIAFAGTILKIGGECGTLELPAIIYVHQLQHALKLCRIKMEIEL